MATSNKSKKILEKARKIAAKTKKKKVSKVDVKKKTTSYPEGQNAPQSKKYTQESDKELPAKSTGWRWTKEGAKKLGKSVDSKPTTSDIEKYRNETFKLKGKPNKSGPKGVGDGSHRYLYVERRADKADITRKNKLAKGGELNVHNDDFKGDFTIEWNVKMVGSNANISEENAQYEYETGAFTNDYAQDCFDEIKSKVKPKGWSIKDWSFAGRSNGWFVLICNGDEDYVISGYGDDVTDSQMDKMNSIVEKYSKNYTKELEKFYGDKKEDGGYMAKGGKIPSSEVADFKKYVKEFYGKDEMYSEFFPPLGASNDEINLAVSQYIEYCKTKDDQWGDGDSFDREIVRDIMFYNRGTRKGLEYQRAIKEIFGKDKKEYGGILQPMIGGVNADPRFDIYNTTMFAKKGVEVPEGDEYAKGGKTHEINIEDGDDVKFSFKKKTLLEIYESDDSELDNPVEEIFNEGEVFEVTVFGIDKHKYDVQFGDGSVSFIRKADVNVIEVNGEKYAKGGKTHEQGYDDREDESLAMRHGKIASKDFVGSHKRREHSRRDDAQFEERHKKAYGGLTDSSIELLD